MGTWENVLAKARGWYLGVRVLFLRRLLSVCYGRLCRLERDQKTFKERGGDGEKIH